PTDSGVKKYHSDAMCINASDTERTPGAGRQPYADSGIASASAITLTCTVSRSARDFDRISNAPFSLNVSCARAAVPAVAHAETIARAASQRARRRAPAKRVRVKRP